MIKMKAEDIIWEGIMSATDKTKQLLADTLEEMMKRKDLKDIHIQDICDKAGVSRPTFYYHFRDKYDLVAWIYLQDMIAAYKEAGVTSVARGKEPYMEQMRVSLRKFREREGFYQSALKQLDQNSLRESMWQSCVNSSLNEIRTILGTNTLSSELEDAVKFYYYGINDLTCDWITGDLKRTEEEMVRYYLDFMPKVMSRAYVKGVDSGAK